MKLELTEAMEHRVAGLMRAITDSEGHVIPVPTTTIVLKNSGNSEDIALTELEENEEEIIEGFRQSIFVKDPS